jgi:hypothetical protein
MPIKLIQNNNNAQKVELRTTTKLIKFQVEAADLLM